MNGLAFVNSTPHGRYGNAKTWAATARANGYAVDMNPAVGAVAWWDAYAYGMSSYGHVAWVRDVNGNDVIIEEYNNPGGGTWRIRTINKNYVSGYIHFKDLSGSSSGGGTSGPPPAPAPHLYENQHWSTHSGMSEVRQLSASSNYTAWAGGWVTPDGWHGGDAVDYGMADANGDGVQDMYVILYCCTHSGMTEVKILSGASNFTQWVGGWVTADPFHAPGTVHYAVGMFDADSKPDLYVIHHNNTPSGHVEVKVLTGASNFSSWAGGWVTPEGWHDGNSVAYTAGGCNANGKPNIYEIIHGYTNSGMTEVRALNGSTNFGTWVGGWVTPDGWHTGYDIDYVMPMS